MHGSSRIEGRDARMERVLPGDQVWVGSASVGPGGGNQRKATVLSVTTRNGVTVRFEDGSEGGYDCASVWKIVTGGEHFVCYPDDRATPPVGASDRQPDAGANSHVGNAGNKRG